MAKKSGNNWSAKRNRKRKMIQKAMKQIPSSSNDVNSHIFKRGISIGEYLRKKTGHVSSSFNVSFNARIFRSKLKPKKDLPDRNVEKDQSTPNPIVSNEDQSKIERRPVITVHVDKNETLPLKSSKNGQPITTQNSNPNEDYNSLSDNEVAMHVKLHDLLGQCLADDRSFPTVVKDSRFLDFLDSLGEIALSLDKDGLPCSTRDLLASTLRPKEAEVDDKSNKDEQGQSKAGSPTDKDITRSYVREEGIEETPNQSECSPRTTSVIWKIGLYERLGETEYKRLVKCVECNQIYNIKRTTVQLRRHLNKHEEYLRKFKKLDLKKKLNGLEVDIHNESNSTSRGIQTPILRSREKSDESYKQQAGDSSSSNWEVETEEDSDDVGEEDSEYAGKKQEEENQIRNGTTLRSPASAIWRIGLYKRQGTDTLSKQDVQCVECGQVYNVKHTIDCLKRHLKHHKEYIEKFRKLVSKKELPYLTKLGLLDVPTGKDAEAETNIAETVEALKRKIFEAEATRNIGEGGEAFEEKKLVFKELIAKDNRLLTRDGIQYKYKRYKVINESEVWTCAKYNSRNRCPGKVEVDSTWHQHEDGSRFKFGKFMCADHKHDNIIPKRSDQERVERSRARESAVCKVGLFTRNNDGTLLRCNKCSKTFFVKFGYSHAKRHLIKFHPEYTKELYKLEAEMLHHRRKKTSKQLKTNTGVKLLEDQSYSDKQEIEEPNTSSKAQIGMLSIFPNHFSSNNVVNSNSTIPDSEDVLMNIRLHDLLGQCLADNRPFSEIAEDQRYYDFLDTLIQLALSMNKDGLSCSARDLLAPTFKSAGGQSENQQMKMEVMDSDYVEQEQNQTEVLAPRSAENQPSSSSRILVDLKPPQFSPCERRNESLMQNVCNKDEQRPDESQTNCPTNSSLCFLSAPIWRIGLFKKLGTETADKKEVQCMECNKVYNVKNTTYSLKSHLVCHEEYFEKFKKLEEKKKRKNAPNMDKQEEEKPVWQNLAEKIQRKNTPNADREKEMPIWRIGLFKQLGPETTDWKKVQCIECNRIYNAKNTVYSLKSHLVNHQKYFDKFRKFEMDKQRKKK